MIGYRSRDDKTWLIADILLLFSQHGMTALIWASGRGHTEVVDHLLEAGANPDAADKVRDARECKGDSRVMTTRGSALIMRVCIYENRVK